MRTAEERLQDIADHARLIARLVADSDAELPAALDERSTAALAWSFLVIGEAVKALPPSLTDRHPEVDWHGFARLRDVLAHQYFRIDLVELRLAVRNDLPRLRAAVDAELRRRPGDP